MAIRGWGALVLPMMVACAQGGAVGSGDPETRSSTPEALRVDIDRNGAAFEFAERDALPHGVAGDERFVFVAEPLHGRVAVLDRVTGRELGVVPPPAGGFLLPFTVRVPRTGRLVVLDSGGFPSPTVPSIPRVYDYDYAPVRGRAAPEARLVRSVRFDGLPLLFTEELEVTPAGWYIVSESVLGALWIVDTDGRILPGLFPTNPMAPLPGLGPCALGTVNVGGVPFTTAGNFAPGVGAMAVRDGQLYFSSTCHGGIRRLSLATLRDGSRSAEDRVREVEVVSPRPEGTVESLKGLAFNRWDARDRRLYAMDPFHLRVLRIDVTTGARQTVNDDPELFNFPVSASFLPPTVPGLGAPLLVVSDQEHRLAALNAAIPSDQFVAPFLITRVYPRR